MNTHLAAYCLKHMGIETWNAHEALPAALKTDYQILPLSNVHGQVAGNLWLEAPQGSTFASNVWQLLDAMLAAVGISRATPATPISDKPQLQIVMGENLAQQLLQNSAPLDKLREKNIYLDQDKTPWLITYHPVDLLRTPQNKAKAWEDLKKIKLMDSTP